MTTTQSRVLMAVVAAVVVVVIVIGTKRYTTGTRPVEKPVPKLPPVTAWKVPATARTTPVGPATRRIPLGPIAEADRAKAMVMLNQGLGLLDAGELLKARSAIADALNTGALSEPQAGIARGRLAGLAQTTLFGRRVIKGDPCTFWYKLQAGDMLAPLERRLRLHVPHQILMLINGIPDDTKIRFGQTLKMIRGPFHAVVRKRLFVMDVFLEETNTGRMIFVRRFPVGTGRDGATPIGRWRVALGKKMKHASWTPPVSSGLPQRKILWREPGYPLGKNGYWISLEGTDGNPHTAKDGYGIHGTNDLASIGRASSLGCIRLSDSDIAVVFSMLYEKWSTVTVTK